MITLFRIMLPMGFFCSKMAFQTICNSGMSSSSWSVIWKSKYLPRIVMFLWLLLHARIASKSLLFLRKIVAIDVCDVCFVSIETALHSVRDCHIAKATW